MTAAATKPPVTGGTRNDNPSKSAHRDLDNDTHDKSNTKEGAYHHHNHHDSTGETTTKPRLYVRVEPMVKPTKSTDPSLDSLVYVNDDEHPVLINNEYFTGHVVFRVRNFRGWTPIDEKTGLPRPPIPDSPLYFAGHKRTFSLQLSGRFRKQWTGDDIMFGTFFHKRLTLPRGSGLALAFAQRIDPSMQYDANIDQPYICSPIVCAMNAINVQPLLAPSASNPGGLRRAQTCVVPSCMRRPYVPN